ncbi:hypothetical protein DFH11DRAFT_1547906 [Phellopilus nigrolimitatus]|nr:hypothetical protein DFH11DRAFT_1547906 [Phellopilus nigrolimitatus]
MTSGPERRRRTARAPSFEDTKKLLRLGTVGLSWVSTAADRRSFTVLKRSSTIIPCELPLFSQHRVVKTARNPWHARRALSRHDASPAAGAISLRIENVVFSSSFLETGLPWRAGGDIPERERGLDRTAHRTVGAVSLLAHPRADAGNFGEFYRVSDIHKNQEDRLAYVAVSVSFHLPRKSCTKYAILNSKLRIV